MKYWVSINKLRLEPFLLGDTRQLNLNHDLDLFLVVSMEIAIRFVFYLRISGNQKNLSLIFYKKVENHIKNHIEIKKITVKEIAIREKS